MKNVLLCFKKENAPKEKFGFGSLVLLPIKLDLRGAEYLKFGFHQFFIFK